MNKLHMRIQDVLSFPQYWVDWIIYNGYEYINVRETSTGYELIAGVNSITIPINTQVVIDLTDVGRAEYQLQQTEHKLAIATTVLEAVAKFDYLYTGYCDDQLLSRAAVMAQWQVAAQDALKAVDGD